jgi:hypothetical protein
VTSDAGTFNDSWENHLKTLQRTLTHLQDNDFAVNPLKCEWGMQETDHCSGCLLMPDGLKPWKKMIEAILKI